MNPTYVTFVVVSVFALSLAQNSDVQTLLLYNRQCNIEVSGSPVNDAISKEHVFCVNKKLGIQNEAGDIQTGALREYIRKRVTDDSRAAQLTDTCNVQKSSPEETALELNKCVFEGIQS